MVVHVHGYMQLVVHVHQNEVATVWMIPFLYHIDIQHSAEIFNTLHVHSKTMSLLVSLQEFVVLSCAVTNRATALLPGVGHTCTNNFMLHFVTHNVALLFLAG